MFEVGIRVLVEGVGVVCTEEPVGGGESGMYWQLPVLVPHNCLHCSIVLQIIFVTDGALPLVLAGTVCVGGIGCALGGVAVVVVFGTTVPEVLEV
jgi:hypothetical protein